MSPLSWATLFPQNLPEPLKSSPKGKILPNLVTLFQLACRGFSVTNTILLGVFISCKENEVLLISAFYCYFFKIKKMLAYCFFTL